jgi:uncharacterized membrane protein YqaE (UPF0057 family)
MKKALPVFIGLAIAMFASCTMEKRHYMPGFHTEWKNTVKHDGVKKDAASVNSEPVAFAPAAAQSTAAATEIAPAPQMAQSSSPAVSPVNFVSKPAKAVQAAKEITGENSVKQAAVKVQKSQHPATPDTPSKGLMILLAILIPWLAVGIVTDWDVKQVVINLLLCLTCIGGIIHAIIVVNREM